MKGILKIIKEMYYKNGNREMGDYSNGKNVGKHVVLTLYGDTHSNNYQTNYY